MKYLVKRSTVVAVCVVCFIFVGLTQRSVDSSPIVAAAPAATITPTPGLVQAIAETGSMPHKNDAADDPAIWVHPSDPTLSTVIGTDKLGGIAVYGLDGKQIQYRYDGKINNVDLRYQFPLGGQRVALVVGTNVSDDSLEVYRVNPDTRKLEKVAARTISTGIKLYGTCMYHSPVSGKYYVFVTRDPYPLDDPSINTGEIRQYELFETNGKVDARQVRLFQVGSNTEGCVADDETGKIYLGETNKAIWEYGAEPDADTTRVNIGTIGDGRLRGEIEGVTLYYTGQNTGYIIASMQSVNEYAVFRREGSHEYLGSFKIGENKAAGIDAVGDTDGIDVVNLPLGAGFEQGMFVAQDGSNSPRSSYTNFKLVSWGAIARAFAPALATDTTWDPRLIGAPAGYVTVTPTITPITTATTATAMPTATSAAIATTSTAAPSASATVAPLETDIPAASATVPTATASLDATPVPSIQPASVSALVPRVWLPMLSQ